MLKICRSWRWLLPAAFAIAVAAPAHAQYADQTQGLFDTPRPHPKNDIIIMEFSTAPEKKPVGPKYTGAQSVEELCCKESAEQRKNDGLCFDVVCNGSSAKQSSSDQSTEPKQ